MDIRKSSLYFMGARLVFVCSAYFLHVFAAYYFDDPVTYGNLAVALNISAIGLVFIQFGFPQSISKFISDNKKISYNIFLSGKYAYMIFGAVIFICYILLIPFWVYITDDKSLIPVILASSLLIPIFTYNNSFMSYLNGCQRFKEQSFFVALYPFNRILFSLAFIFLGFKICGIFIGFVVAGIINGLLLTIKIRRKKMKRTYPLRPIVKFAIPVVFMSIGIALYMNIDMVIVKHFFKDNDVIGFYAASSTISKVPYYIYFAYSMTIIPVVSRYIKDLKFHDSVSAIKKCLFSLGILGCFSCIGVGLFSNDILDFIYPAGYSSLSHIMTILFISMFLLSFYQTLASIFIAIGNVVMVTSITYIILLLQVVASMICIPYFGIIGMAYSSIFPIIFGSTILVIYLVRAVHSMTKKDLCA